MCSARAAAERERATLEQDQRLALTELELLQKDFDAVSTTVRMLEMQKSEAQKRLDELDDKVSCSISRTLVRSWCSSAHVVHITSIIELNLQRKKLQMAVKDLKDKSEEEKREVS